MDTSAWMRAYKTQVVERRREQAAEVVEPRLERRPRNPVVYSIHSRQGGNDNTRQYSPNIAQFAGGGQQREPGHHAVGVETVGVAVEVLAGAGRDAAVVKRQRFE